MPEDFCDMMVLLHQVGLVLSQLRWHAEHSSSLKFLVIFGN